MKSLLNTNLNHWRYASGNCGKSAIWTFVEVFLLFYFTEIIGISAHIAGMLIMLTLVWDALTDPFIAYLAERGGDRKKVILNAFKLGAPIAAISIVCIFLSPLIATDYRFIYIFVFLIIFRMAYTIVDVPHNSLLSLITSDSKQVTALASMRIFFSAIGRITVMLSSGYLLNENPPEDIEERFAIIAFVCALFYLIFIHLSYTSIKSLKIKSQQNNSAKAGFITIFSNIIQSVQIRYVFILSAITSLATPLIGSTFLYYSKYSLLNESFATTALTIMAVVQTVSLLFWTWIANRLTHKSYALMLANFVLFIAMILGSLLKGHILAFYFTAGLTGFSIGGIYMLNWALLPDAINAAEKQRGERFDFGVVGLFTFTNKIFIGLSQALIGWVLVLFGLNLDNSLTVESMNNVYQTLILLPIFGSLACIYILKRFKQLI